MTWLTMQEAAARTGYSTRTLERYVSAGKLTAYRTRHGARLRFRSDDLDALFAPVAVS